MILAPPPLSWIVSPADGTEQWIALDLGNLQTVGDVKIAGGMIGSGDVGEIMFNATPQFYQIQYSPYTDELGGANTFENISWNDIAGANQDGNLYKNNSNSMVLENSFSQISNVRYIRILLPTIPIVPTTGSTRVVSISEISVYANSWADLRGHISGAIQSPNGQYFQYKVVMTSGSTPILNGVAVSSNEPPPPPVTPPSAPTYIPPEEKGENSEAPAEETAETIVSPQICTNTLDEVQITPIPPFPEEWGQGYPKGRAQWALDHRRNIYQLYLDYLGRAPCAVEVNWQMTHDSDIYNIRFNMITSEEYMDKQGGE